MEKLVSIFILCLPEGFRTGGWLGSVWDSDPACVFKAVRRAAVLLSSHSVDYQGGPCCSQCRR